MSAYALRRQRNDEIHPHARVHTVTYQTESGMANRAENAIANQAETVIGPSGDTE